MEISRLDRVTAALRAQRMAGLALMPDANLTYLTGLTFHHGKRLTLAIFPADGSQPCFIIPALERDRVEASSSIVMRYFPWADADGPAEAARAGLAAALGPELRGRPMGVEYTALRVMELRGMEVAMPGIQVADATALLAELRMAKDAEELAIMEEAARIVEAGLSRTIAQIRAGMTERQLSKILSEEIMAAGGEGESFDNMVASGPNGANPHHSNSDRALTAGDLIIFDCGARYKGYISDITRTVALGEPDAEARAVYELVRRANEAGKAVARPEASGAEIDAAARQVIDAGGYGQYFIHRTGHGIGLEVHELPNIMAGSDEPLAPGTTFTIEPGIYIPGRLGVRIEDDMVITADGARSLTSMSRELLIIPA
ncbi:Xaa-Pro peptidase family protein [Oscillochloris sp. ZM17-4]|uniref:M24 family metallopeptidase n=1 Tax=Oscillochloris sp. ZM17-4 TaxID=2866714 RepID=UPI001C735B60|nr:Xaa-Pro peptidase family protein [Oscillochloris sp. ZM17-4]MBX0329147.1 Xaa-Pro peptidase family protein [Oscillochloris sp. ZM17-4]